MITIEFQYLTEAATQQVNKEQAGRADSEMRRLMHGMTPWLLPC
jgi:hypothetical protein